MCIGMKFGTFGLNLTSHCGYVTFHSHFVRKELIYFYVELSMNVLQTFFFSFKYVTNTYYYF